MTQPFGFRGRLKKTTTCTMNTSSLQRMKMPHVCHVCRVKPYEDEKISHKGRSNIIHVQYTQTKSIRPRHFTIRLDPWNNDTWTFHVLKTWPQTSVDSYDSCRFDRIDSNRQHFQPTLKFQINYNRRPDIRGWHIAYDMAIAMAKEFWRGRG